MSLANFQTGTNDTHPFVPTARLKGDAMDDSKDNKERIKQLEKDLLKLKKLVSKLEERIEDLEAPNRKSTSWTPMTLPKPRRSPRRPPPTSSRHRPAAPKSAEAQTRQLRSPAAEASNSEDVRHVFSCETAIRSTIAVSNR